MTNVYENSARSAKGALVVGWWPWLRRRNQGEEFGGRRRKTGKICAAPSYAAILTSWKTSSASLPPDRHTKHQARLWKVWNAGSYWGKDAGWPGNLMEIFILVRKQVQRFYSEKEPEKQIRRTRIKGGGRSSNTCLKRDSTRCLQFLSFLVSYLVWHFRAVALLEKSRDRRVK